MRKLYSSIVAAVLAVTAFGAAAEPRSAYDIAIASPADDSTVFSDSGDVSVRVAVSPALGNGDRVELLVDGASVAPPMAVLDFPLQGVTRGQHVLEVRVIDATGNVASSSGATVFYVWQASLLFPSRDKTDGTSHPSQSSAIPAGVSGAESNVGLPLSDVGTAARGGYAIHGGSAIHAGR
jgi:hypothetical protein